MTLVFEQVLPWLREQGVLDDATFDHRVRGQPAPLASARVGPARLAAQARARRQPGRRVDAGDHRQQQPRRPRGRARDGHGRAAAPRPQLAEAQTGWSPRGAASVTRIRDPAR